VHSDPKPASDELALLSQEQRAWLDDDQTLRVRADDVGRELGLDPHDVYRVLKQLRRSPSERLRRGLAHGRLGRLAHR